MLLLEAAEPISKEKQAEYPEAFEKMLCKVNVSVMPMLKSGSLGRCEVKFLRRGTYDEYREVLRARGANLNQVKPIKVIDNDEKKEFFFSRITEEADK